MCSFNAARSFNTPATTRDTARTTPAPRAAPGAAVRPRTPPRRVVHAKPKESSHENPRSAQFGSSPGDEKPALASCPSRVPQPDVESSNRDVTQRAPPPPGSRKPGQGLGPTGRNVSRRERSAPPPRPRPGTSAAAPRAAGREQRGGGSPRHLPECASGRRLCLPPWQRTPRRAPRSAPGGST